MKILALHKDVAYLRCQGACDMHMIGHQAIPADTHPILRPLTHPTVPGTHTAVLHKKYILFIVASAG